MSLLRAQDTPTPRHRRCFVTGLRPYVPQAPYPDVIKGHGPDRWACRRNSPLVDEEFRTDNEMLTPTMKVKRRKVLERYGEQIEALYAKGPPDRE